MAGEEMIGKGRMDALLSKAGPKEPMMEPEESEDDGAGILEGIIGQLTQDVLPHADPEKAAKVQQAIDILTGCLEGDSEPPTEEPKISAADAGSGLPPM